MMELVFISFITGMSTLIGSLTIIWFKKPEQKMMALYLGLSGGIMALLVLVELLPASLEQAPVSTAAVGIILGVGFMTAARWFVYYYFKNSTGHLPLGWMIVLAMAFHNFPEGMAIGAGFEAHYKLGIVIAFSIALHNVPEGVALAAPFVAARMKKSWIIFIVVGVSLFIPLGTIVGAWLIQLTSWGLGMAIASACGAMGYIVMKEIIPSAFRYHSLFALYGMAGSVIIMYIIQQLH